MTKSRWLFRYIQAAVLLIALLQLNCFYALQSFNHGKLLTPGETRTTYAISRRPFSQINRNPADTLTYEDVAVSMNYRLGILAKKPFGKGLEVGFHLEFPTQLNYPILEFDGRFGLPDLIVSPLLYHHNIGVGWMVGQWIDNGWYLEYAGGFESELFIPYANVRCILTPTAATDMNLQSDSPLFGKHDRRVLMRGALGCTIKLPRIDFLPDFVTPEISMVYPDPWNPTRVTWSYQIGLGWHNGL